MDLPDCPPGTEGYEEDIPISVKPNLDGTKAEQEFQIYVHNFKVKLQDGSLRNMVERKERDSVGQWVYLCYPCGVTCKGESTMQSHIIGKKHLMRLENSKMWPLSIFNEHPYYHEASNKTKSTEKPYSVLDVIINEPCALQPVIDEHKSSALVGLEYLVELDPEEENHVKQYYCLLCDKQGHPRSIFDHFNTYRHHSCFVERHYCTVHRTLGPYRKKEFEKGMRAMLKTLVTRVEQAHGRMKPLRTTHLHFQKNRADIFKHILDGPHISEKTGPNFIEVVDEDLIHFLSKNNAETKQPSLPAVPTTHPTAGKQTTFQSTTQPKVANHDSTKSLLIKNLSSPEASLVLNNNQKKREAGSERPAENIKRARPNSPQSEGYDVIKYIKYQQKLNILEERVQKLTDDLNEKLSYHEKNPEKHPIYSEEWKKFWNRRYKELQNENKDPTKFDFKPEWIVFWTKRMKELHDEEFQSQKNDACRRLNVPFDVLDTKGKIVTRRCKPPSQSPERQSIPTHRTSPRRSPHRYSPRRSPVRRSPPHRSLASQRSSTRRYSPTHNRLRYQHSPARRRSPLSHRPGSRPTRRAEPHSNHRSPSRRVDRNCSGPRDSSTSHISDEELKLMEDGNLSPWGDSDSLKSAGSATTVRRSAASSTSRVVAPGQDDVICILRFLSALEDYLGSIGARVVDLLTEALKMEKNSPNSSEELLLDEAHIVLLDTAKEKLKGAVHAGLVPTGVMGAARDAITRTAALLHHAEILKRNRAEKEKADKLKADREGVCVPGIGAVEKAAIARQIAAALIAQGKTDVTTEELASLVDAVIGMAKAKRSTASHKDTTSQGESGKKVVSTTAQSQSSGSALQMLRVAYEEKTVRLESQEKPKPVERNDQESINCPKEAEKSNMDSLSDSDLKTLLQNFKDLSSDEQHDLIGYLRKLESSEPGRVERLRQFVDLQSPTTTNADTMPYATAIDSDDDDFNDDEVFKSAALKVKENQIQQEMEVVQKSLLQVQPAEDVSKVLASLLNSLPPPASPRMLAPVVQVSTAVSHIPATESVSQPPISVPHLNLYADNLANEAAKLYNHFQSVTPNFSKDQENSTFYHNPQHQLNRTTPVEDVTYAQRQNMEQMVQNQPVPLNQPTFQQHAGKGSIQWEGGAERTYDERFFTQKQQGGNINHHYEGNATPDNNVFSNMNYTGTWNDRSQGHNRGGGNRGNRGRGKWNRGRWGGNYSNFN